MKGRWIVAVLLITVVGLMVRANLQKTVRSGARASGVPEVRVAAVTRSPFVARIVAPASMGAAEDAELRAPFTAASVRVNVKVGDRVALDQVLFELDTDQVQIDIRKQETAVAQARTALAQARLQAEIAPWNDQVRLQEAERRVTRTEKALADARTAAVDEAADLRTKLTDARAALVKARSAQATTGPVELAAARQAVAAATVELAADPSDRTRHEALARAQAAYRDLERQGLAQAEATVAKIRAAADEVARIEEQITTQVAAAQDKILTATTDLEKAQFDLRKVKLEIGSSAVQSDLRNAEQNLVNAEKILADLASKAEKAAVRSPFAGVVLDVKVTSGQSVNSGVPLALVAVIDRLRLNIQVDEADIGRLSVGLPLVLRTAAFPGQPFTGRITDVSVQAGAQQQGRPGAAASFLVRGEVQNPGQRLRIGQNGDVEIVASTRENVIMLGAEAVRSGDGQRYVFVLGGEVARRRDIEVGIRNRSQVEIVSGLEPGELVVTSPFAVLRQLTDGQAVKVAGGLPGAPAQGPAPSLPAPRAPATPSPTPRAPTVPGGGGGR